ncbi:hypothetical protein [Frankia sp. R82]|nr:hypothetical protein [Frankia sp. R82]
MRDGAASAEVGLPPYGSDSPPSRFLTRTGLSLPAPGLVNELY